jgi:hypothetical protein
MQPSEFPISSEIYHGFLVRQELLMKISSLCYDFTFTHRYHQVKFIERQKLTRLEKSVKRQLGQLIERPNDDKIQQQITQLERQLQSIAMDQLYIAFFPTNMKYMALFTNGMDRVVDDERGRKRRCGVWNVIREGFMQELKQEDDDDDKNAGDDDASDSSNDSSSVPSSDTDSEQGTEDRNKHKACGIATTTQMKLRLVNAKKWVNLDEAKKALLSMPADTYPNATYLSSETADASTLSSSSSFISKVNEQNKKSSLKKESNGNDRRALPKTESSKKAVKTITETSSDSRFTLSCDFDKLFEQSTRGDDYHTELKLKVGQNTKDDIDSDGDYEDINSDSSSDDDEADPLKGYANKKVASSTTNDKRGDKSSSPTSSSSSSSEDSSDSESSDSSGSNSNLALSNLTTKMNYNKQANANVKHSDDAEDIDGDNDAGADNQDDFFAANDGVTTEDIFTQVQNQKKRNPSSSVNGAGAGRSFNNRENGDITPHDYQKRGKKPDKSRGFKTQNQSKREYASFQHRNKRQKFA